MGEGAAGTVANADTRINIHLLIFFLHAKIKRCDRAIRWSSLSAFAPLPFTIYILMRFFNFPHDLKMQIS